MMFARKVLCGTVLLTFSALTVFAALFAINVIILLIGFLT